MEAAEVPAEENHERPIRLTASQALRGARGRQLPCELNGLVGTEEPVTQITPLRAHGRVAEADDRRRVRRRLSHEAVASDAQLEALQQAELQQEGAPGSALAVAAITVFNAGLQLHHAELSRQGRGGEGRPVRVDLDRIVRAGAGGRRHGQGDERRGATE